MKQPAVRLLVVLNLVLLGALLLAWVTADRSLRGTQWEPPAPRLTDFSGQLPVLPTLAPLDTTNFVAMLDKPLFSATRRPPPPPPPPPVAAQEAPPDNFSTAKLTGIFNSGGVSGIIIRMAGKDSRVQLNQSLDGWALKSIAGRQATFASGGQTRVLQLLRADMSGLPAAGSVSAGGASRPANVAPRSAYPFLPVSPSNVPSPVSAPVDAASGDASGPSAAGAAPVAPPAPRAVFGGSRR